MIWAVACIRHYSTLAISAPLAILTKYRLDLGDARRAPRFAAQSREDLIGGACAGVPLCADQAFADSITDADNHERRS
jgi:hypothetical protein